MKSQYLKNVATLKLEQSRCTGCGKCFEVCPHQVFAIMNSKATIVEKDRCIECGACVKNCPFHALEVKPGVGCASAIIKGWLTGTEPSCDCSPDSGGCC
ncbi:4Fe-4S protein [Desulfitobacterium dichloroeliminans LMG P-21439]|uniref:4Fe-4S protein n=1 Tax=Desulfitobacterium dichloroeliminans (strain LMG P-21439 / DCA1) TaxID=871963 RepID=L0F6M2_DESDL|nr:mercury methylation ferredoxin HgcB [Desulfitobacterium dichloroeliminans]AGA68306.1 4Fe-4S protein [Desulfitobacterium dichloroeliminans LMG P-21439]